MLRHTIPKKEAIALAASVGPMPEVPIMTPAMEGQMIREACICITFSATAFCLCSADTRL